MELHTASEYEPDVMTIISQLRGKLISAGLEEGFNSENTLKISKELDQWIYVYQKKELKK
ncbi:aspartyl-phosphate phosphatase Spo0E family protein [Metabacillus sp. GX 13764]|uniref:aspartyl-phosphate phosphatase Spo0E family protein n=1 Tax=Metabacillus kandeliae TaxID=2900151 RepID=UPI001E4E30CE|nr:aspartyl-phosphate phosphatase Spo0E family protein [Metabacillus kandeliae]MCD7034104.1 aspartyl-phosphate phosphatase Spo0E family protein [Metabacillus kandeliae]